MKDYEKLLVFLANEANYSYEKILSFADIKITARLLEKLISYRLIQKVSVNYNFAKEPNLTIGSQPLLTNSGFELVEELAKPWWQKLKFKGIAITTICAILMVLANLDKIESNSHKLVNFVICNVGLK